MAAPLMNLQTLKLSDINSAQYNPRTWTRDEFNGMLASLRAFGQQENLIVNKSTGNTLVSGHLRLTAMAELGWSEAVCNIVELSERQEKKLNVTMNNQKISGDFDMTKLPEILEELKLDEDYEELRLNKLEELDLSSRYDDPNSEWSDMPEFNQDDLMAAKRLIVNFRSDADLAKFAKLAGQPVHMTTRSIWYPEAEKVKVADKVYAEEA